MCYHEEIPSKLNDVRSYSAIVAIILIVKSLSTIKMLYHE